MSSNDQIYLGAPFTNSDSSPTGLRAGDVVELDLTNNASVRRTTTASSTSVFGIIVVGGSPNSKVLVASFRGQRLRVNVSPSEVVAIGDRIVSSATAGLAKVDNAAADAAIFAVAIASKTAGVGSTVEVVFAAVGVGVEVTGDATPTTRVLTAGTGLTGGGDLTANRTFNVVGNADGSIVVNADDVQVGVITDGQHGNRGGGSLHPTATTSVAGFMSAADKTTFDALVPFVARQPKPGEFWTVKIDYDAGNDTTGAIGVATSEASSLAAAAPFKTIEKAGQLIPREGSSASLLVLVKPHLVSGVATVYRNIANSADETGSWLNGLNNWHFLGRGSLDFANDSNDKIRAGFVAAAGANAGGYNVVPTIRTITVTGTDHVTAVVDPVGFASVPTWTLANGGFGPNDIDTNLTMSGITNAGVRRILQVLSPTSVTTDGSVTNETFNTGTPLASVTSSRRAFLCQLAGGGAPSLPAESSGFSTYSGLRIRFRLTTTTAGLQNIAVGIIKNTTTIIKGMFVLPADPVAGDIFDIETPGVLVANLTHTAGLNRSFCLVGFSCTTGTTTMQHLTSTSRIAGCNFVNLVFTNGVNFVCLSNYVDEADATIVIGYGVRISGSCTASLTETFSISHSAWLGLALQCVATVIQSVVGSGCLGVQGYTNPSTYGRSTSFVGNIGSVTAHRFRVTGAASIGNPAINLGGIGAAIRGVDFANCVGAGIGVTRQNSGTGTWSIDDIVDPDGNNAPNTASPNETCCVRIASGKDNDGLVVLIGDTPGAPANMTARFDRDIAGDGGFRARFSDLKIQNLVVGGMHIYWGLPPLFDWNNDINQGPSVDRECGGGVAFNPGPFPSFRAWRAVGNIIDSAPCQIELASADTSAHCHGLWAVVPHRVEALGDKAWGIIGGSTKIEFVAGTLTNHMPDPVGIAYLSELTGADTGKARIGPPPTGVAVPLGPIQSIDYASAPDFNPSSPTSLCHPIYAQVNLVNLGLLYVPTEGHAALSVVGNLTGSRGPATDIPVASLAAANRVANVATMVALNVLDGNLVRVDTYRDFFYLDKSYPGVAVPDSVIQSTVNSLWFWIRLNIADPYWAAQTAWEWHPSTGSNEATGRPGFPVKTHTEIERRCGTYPVLADTTIRLLATATEVPVVRRTPPGIGLAGGIAPGASALYYTCTPTKRVVDGGTGTTGTITTLVSQENKSTNTPLVITASILPSAGAWTGHLNKAIRFFRSGVPVATSFIQRDLGSKTAQIGYLGNVTDTPQLCAFGQGLGPGNVLVGDTFEVYDRFSMPGPVIPTGQFVVLHAIAGPSINSGIINEGLPVGPGVVHANWCDYGAIVANPGTCPTFMTMCYASSADMKTGTFGRITASHFGSLTMRKNNWEIDGQDIRIIVTSALPNGGLYLSGYIMPDQSSGVDIGIWNSVVSISCGSSAIALRSLWGSGNSVLSSLRLSNNSSRVTLINTPVITNSAGDFAVNGVSHTWADTLPVIDLPFDNSVMAVGS